MAIYNGDISISANFQLNINKPLDARTVVDAVSDLTSISFKYQGMLVYIKNDDKYYSYNGTVWTELNTGGSSGVGFIPLTGTVLNSPVTGDIVVDNTTTPRFYGSYTDSDNYSYLKIDIPFGVSLRNKWLGETENYIQVQNGFLTSLSAEIFLSTISSSAFFASNGSIGFYSNSGVNVSNSGAGLILSAPNGMVIPNKSDEDSYYGSGGLMFFNTTTQKYRGMVNDVLVDFITNDVLENDYVDLYNDQDIDGVKSFFNDILINGMTIGNGTGADSTNIAIGEQSLFTNDGGINNTALGFNTLYFNEDGSFNTAIGSESLYTNISGNGNIAIGHRVLYSNTTGFTNIGIGNGALYSNTEGNVNTAIGFRALRSNLLGSENVSMGDRALEFNTTGSYNTAIGVNTLQNNIIGSYNTAIGYGASVQLDEYDNSTAIGANSIINESNTIQLGDANITKVKTSGKFISGEITYPNTDGTVNQVLATDGNGIIGWIDSGSNLNIYKTIFVDISNGNDLTGIKYNTNKRYASVKKAMEVAVSGDTIYVLPGLYDEYNIAPVNNTTLYLCENAIIQPSTNSGNVPVITDLAIPSWWTVLYSMEMNFKIRGKGKILNKGATAQYNNAALMLVLAKSRWDVELDTLSSYQIYGGSSLIIKNTKITLSGCAFRHSIQVRPSVIHIDCEFQNAHIGLIPLGTLGLRHMSFKRCKFIRTVAVSEFDSLITGTDTVLWDSPLGLDTVKFPNVSVGHQHGSYDEFIECEFYNYVGGDNIVIGDSPATNANFIIRDCRFTNTNTDLSRGTGCAIKVRGGLTTATKLYMYNNIADTVPVYESTPLTVNLLSGNGMIISDNDMGIAYYNRLIGTINWN